MSYRTVSAARAMLLAGSAAIVAMPAQAYAQEKVAAEANQQADEADPAETIGDIVVTARRRNEILQDVPIAVTAYSGAALGVRVNAAGGIALTVTGDVSVESTGSSAVGLSASSGSSATVTLTGDLYSDVDNPFMSNTGIFVNARSAKRSVPSTSGCRSNELNRERTAELPASSFH